LDSTEYYNQYAHEYFDRTVDLDLSESWERFMGLLPDGGSILDLGCGSGRDSAYFKAKGYDVTAVDGSEQMCSLAGIHIGQDVLNLQFSDIDFDKVFDGVWACASLLHVPSKEMPGIFHKIFKSIKPCGILYMSFKYGEFEGVRDGRYFTDLRIRRLKELLSGFDNIEILDLWKSEHAGEEECIWLNALVRKLV
jgi:SAM-dependent methyltransferase